MVIEINELKSINDKALENFASTFNMMLAEDMKVELEAVCEEIEETFNKLEGNIITALSQVIGDIEGNIIFTCPRDKGLRIIEKLSAKAEGSIDSIDEEGESAFKEFLNIAGSAYLNEIANKYNMEIFPSPPICKEGDFRQVLCQIKEGYIPVTEVYYIYVFNIKKNEESIGRFFCLFSKKFIKEN